MCDVVVATVEQVAPCVADVRDGNTYIVTELVLYREIPLIDRVRRILTIHPESRRIERRRVLAGVAGLTKISNPETNVGGPDFSNIAGAYGSF